MKMPAQEEEKPTSYKSLTSILTESIREDIYDGLYRPGARINISELAVKFNTSAIPVREALRSLDAEGLVEFQPNRGVVVRDLSADELRELYLIRLPLEVLAAEQLLAKAKKTSVKGLLKILSAMDSAGVGNKWHELHKEFHTQFYALSGLPRLAQYLNVLRGQMLPYSRLYLSDPTHVAQAQIEHYAMVEAALDEDVEKLREIIHEHVRRPTYLALAKVGQAESAELEAPVAASRQRR